MPNKGGWLVNKKRKSRRDHPNTLTDNNVLKMINKIKNTDFYLSETIAGRKPLLNVLLKMRDKALISTIWIFFKRGSEVLRLKREDVSMTDKEIIITFIISKKTKRYKVCPKCEHVTGHRKKYCNECGENMLDVEILTKGEKKIVTKRKTLKNKFVKYIVEWIQKLDELIEDNEEILIFPPLRIVFSDAFFDFYARKPMTIRNFDYILEKLDPTMTSCMFRYGGTEKYLNRGYSTDELKAIGDWSSARMPEIYAERKGITPPERRWSEDIE